jgi:hypothetical protein
LLVGSGIALGNGDADFTSMDVWHIWLVAFCCWKCTHLVKLIAERLVLEKSESGGNEIYREVQKRCN